MTTTSPRLGWLGTGRMGTQMVLRLLAGGADVTVWNRTAAKCEPLVDKGASQADQISDLADRDIVFLMVTASSDLVQVALGTDGLLAGPIVPAVLVDCSTVDAETSTRVRAAAAERGVAYLAAPVSGNPAMIAEGAGSIVASGPAEVFASVKSQLELIAPSVVLCGPGEEARLVKLCHNLMLGMLTQSLVEVTALAEKGGVSNKAFIDFMGGSVLGSAAMRHKGKAIVERDYEPTFTARYLRKDFDLGLGAARALEVPMPVASTTYQLIQSMIGNGLGESDYVALYELQARACGLAGQVT